MGDFGRVDINGILRVGSCAGHTRDLLFRVKNLKLTKKLTGNIFEKGF
jgi:hypothetical protein